MENFKNKLNSIWRKTQNVAAQNKLTVFVGGAIFIALIMIFTSLWMYENFGAAQLDLSRPSLQEARKEARIQAQKEKERAEKEENFEATGSIDKKVVESFEKIYDKKANQITGEFFGENALSDKTLGIE